MDARAVLRTLGLTGAAHAAPIEGGAAAGFCEDDVVTPASVMKIQVAIAVENLIAEGAVDATSRRVLGTAPRTPGPVGMSLMRDEVTMSVRDLLVAMLTISDNVATDELIAVAGLDEINRRTRELGLVETWIGSDLRGMLDEIAHDAGFGSFEALAGHDPEKDGPPSADEVNARIAGSAALDPSRGTRTTASETVTLLQAIWTDRAGTPEACQGIRDAMARQLTRHRIASGFAPPVRVAAKSGGLLGVVRNESGVVSFPDGHGYAVAVFTRRQAGNTADPARIDASIGRVARLLVDELRSG